jgi:pyruvate ferredoxin oxidoreductase delta subunit
MSKPIQSFTVPGSSKEYKTGTWRTLRPLFKHDTCNDCRICVVVCPDSCVYGHDLKYDADMDYCKGCGICAHECPVDDIDMVVEVK